MDENAISKRSCVEITRFYELGEAIPQAINWLVVGIIYTSKFLLLVSTHSHVAMNRTDYYVLT